MCYTGANNPACIWQRGYDGERCVKPKHVGCPQLLDDDDRDECEKIATRKNSGKQNSEEEK